MTLSGTALPMAEAGPILKPMAVPDGRLGMGVGQVMFKPVVVCDQVSTLALPNSETKPTALTNKLELVASEGILSFVPAAGRPT